MSPRHHAFGPKDITVRRLASLCLAALTLTPVAAALPPVFLSPAAADPAPRPVAPRVTATAFGGVDKVAGPPPCPRRSPLPSPGASRSPR